MWDEKVQWVITLVPEAWAVTYQRLKENTVNVQLVGKWGRRCQRSVGLTEATEDNGTHSKSDLQDVCLCQLLLDWIICYILLHRWSNSTLPTGDLSFWISAKESHVVSEDSFLWEEETWQATSQTHPKSIRNQQLVGTAQHDSHFKHPLHFCTFFSAVPKTEA